MSMFNENERWTRKWRALADDMTRIRVDGMDKRRMFALMRRAERYARRDRRCIRCSLYGDYAVQDFRPDKAWEKAESYIRYCSDRMTAPRWVRISQMLAVAYTYACDEDSEVEEFMATDLDGASCMVKETE